MTTSVLSARGAPPSPVRRGPTPVALGSGLPLALTRRLSHRSRGPHHRSPHLAHTRSTRAQGCRASFGPQALCSMGLAVACVLWATAAGAQTTSTTTTTPAQQSSTSVLRRFPAGHDHVLWRHRPLVRPHGGSIAGRHVVGVGLPARDQLHSGLHQRRRLRRYVRSGYRQPRRDLRGISLRHADRPRREATLLRFAASLAGPRP